MYTRGINGKSFLSIPKTIKGSTAIDLQTSFNNTAEPTSIDILTNTNNPSLKIKTYDNTIDCFEIIDANDNIILKVNKNTLTINNQYLIPTVSNYLTIGSAIKLIKEIFTLTLNASNIIISGDITTTSSSNIGSIGGYFNNLYANNVYSTIRRSSQPYITDLGILTGLNVQSSDNINLISTSGTGDNALYLTPAGSALQGKWTYIHTTTDTGQNSVHIKSDTGGISIYANKSIIIQNTNTTDSGITMTGGSNGVYLSSSGSQCITSTKSSGIGVSIWSTTSTDYRDICLNSYNGGIALLSPKITVASSIIPSVSSSYDIGSSTYCFNNIYSHDGGVHASDLRFKNIISQCIGLDFINKLEAVIYTWKPETLNEARLIDDGKGKQIDEIKTTTKTYSRKHFGIIAQQLKSTLEELELNSNEYGVWCLSDVNNTESKQQVRYEELIPPLIKSIQELNKKIDNIQVANNNNNTAYFISVALDDSVISNIDNITLEHISTGLYRINHNLNSMNYFINVNCYKKVNTLTSYNTIEKTANSFTIQVINFNNVSSIDAQFDCMINVY